MAGKFCSLVFAAAVAVLALAAAAQANYFDAATVKLVDHSTATGNWLFRGNLPKNASDEFGYEALVATFAAEAGAANLSLPSSFYLLDISMLRPNWVTEAADYKMEVEFFASHPELGEVVNWNINGVHHTPVVDACGSDCCFFSNCGVDCLTPAQQKRVGSLFPTYDVDGLDNKTASLYSMLHNPSPKTLPLVIYFHCEAGCDRTGEIYAGYVMRYHNASFQAVDAFDKSICRLTKTTIPVQVVENVNEASLYCLYLESARGYRSPGECWPAVQPPSCDAIVLGSRTYDLSALANGGSGYTVAVPGTGANVSFAVCEILNAPCGANASCNAINASVCDVAAGTPIGSHNTLTIATLASGSDDGLSLHYNSVPYNGDFRNATIRLTCSKAASPPAVVSAPPNLVVEWAVPEGCAVSGTAARGRRG